MFTLAPGTMQSVAVTRMDDFIRGGNLPSLTDRFVWRVSQSQPAAAHHCRYTSDICSSRSSGTKSKTLPVGFHRAWLLDYFWGVQCSYELYDPKLSLGRTRPACICLPFHPCQTVLQAPGKQALEKGIRIWEQLEERDTWTQEKRLRSPLNFCFQKQKTKP